MGISQSGLTHFGLTLAFVFSQDERKRVRKKIVEAGISKTTQLG